ncbi:hypothetical protein Acsp05_17760 [Actinokineospora sp. NBRC 105648]|nr:hypothetical protein Acsp05_17760 [Actinokineospora sp. NBRC 105648]
MKLRVIDSERWLVKRFGDFTSEKRTRKSSRKKLVLQTRGSDRSWGSSTVRASDYERAEVSLGWPGTDKYAVTALRDLVGGSPGAERSQAHIRQDESRCTSSPNSEV